MLPVDHDGDPRVLLRLKTQPVRRPAAFAQPQRHVGGVGLLGHRETGAAAPLRGIDEYAAAATRHNAPLMVRTGGRLAAGSIQALDLMEAGAGKTWWLAGYVGRAA